MNAGMSSLLASGTSSQTAPTVEGGSTTFGASGEVTSDMADMSDGPVKRSRVAPVSALSTAIVLTVAGTVRALVSNSS